MSSNTGAGESVSADHVHANSSSDEKTFGDEKHVEHVVTSSDNVGSGNLVYDDNEEEPELHLRTYIALAAMLLLNLVQVLALMGPPSVVSDDRGASDTPWPD